MNKLITLSILCAVFMSCGNKSESAATSESLKQESPAAETSVKRISIPRDSIVLIHPAATAGESYSIYYPSSAPASDSTPIIICFDPHGDGRLPIDKYKKLADRFGVAIAGSNSSRNGLSMPDGVRIAGNMIADISQALSFSMQNIALCGFSGGSKVALAAAENNPNIANVIYAGAVSAFNPTHTVNLLGYAGQQDMNYTDLLQFDETTSQANPNTALIEWPGKHEWPDAAYFEKAFYWLSFRSIKRTDSGLNKTFRTKMDAMIASDEQSKLPLKAYEDTRIAFVFLNKVADVSVYQNKMNAIKVSADYTSAISHKKQVLDKEANTKQTLLKSFQNENEDWWRKVIGSYQKSTDPSDKRLLGFISLACYSYSNQLLQQENMDGANKILSIYELADPVNTDQLYMHAILYAQKKDNQTALSYLHKAVKNGFKDAEKMSQEPSFTSLRSNADFTHIIASLGQDSR